MKSYGIVYSFHIRHPGTLLSNICYQQLRYSLATLRKYNKSIPVKVFISPEDESHLGTDLRLFENVEVIKTENIYPKTFDDMWIKQGHAEWLYHRWQNAFRAIEDYNFDKILYLDTDTVFYQDIEKLFDLYDEGMIWAREDNSLHIMDVIKLEKAMNDGQFILDKSALNYKKDFNAYTEKYINQTLEFCKGKFDENQMSSQVRWVMIQYAAFSFFKHINKPVKYFDPKYVALHQESDPITQDLILRHYYTGNTSRYLPEEYTWPNYKC